jgi:prolipoprotein diacylglyceryltransferase
MSGLLSFLKLALWFAAILIFTVPVLIETMDAGRLPIAMIITTTIMSSPLILLGLLIHWYQKKQKAKNEQ